jgi:hypothetical protein
MPGYRVLVVGDMAELGDESEACHVQVGEAAKASGIDRVLSTGKLSHAISEASGVGEHFADKAALIARLNALIQEKQIITVSNKIQLPMHAANAVTGNAQAQTAPLDRPFSLMTALEEGFEDHRLFVIGDGGTGISDIDTYS